MLQIYLNGLIGILSLMTTLWIISIFIKNVSIVDMFWGFGFVMTNIVYYISTDIHYLRHYFLLILVFLWGMRLSIYLAKRNIGKGEDFRYQEFRKNYGEKRYWWISYFQTFLLQGILMWIISLPLLGANYYTNSDSISIFDYIALISFIIGIIFEAGGDFQLSKFKKNPANKGKVLNTGLWKYTRHPNYFGDSAVWWSFAFFSIAAQSYWTIIGSIVMTLMIIKVSGVALLEKSLKTQKPEYQEYIRKTSSFIPWFPKK